jgi:hypothetical protein
MRRVPGAGANQIGSELRSLLFLSDKKSPPGGRALVRIIAFLADRLFTERFRDNENQNCATDAPAEKQIEEGVSGRGHG